MNLPPKTDDEIFNELHALSVSEFRQKVHSLKYDITVCSNLLKNFPADYRRIKPKDKKTIKDLLSKIHERQNQLKIINKLFYDSEFLK